MVNWGPDKDAVLLVGILEFQQMGMSRALLQHLADKIGEGCTPKAVSHRLNNLKSKAKIPSTPRKHASGTMAPMSRKRASLTYNMHDDDSITGSSKNYYNPNTPGEHAGGIATPRKRRSKFTFDNGNSLGYDNEQNLNDYPEVDEFLDSKPEKKIKLEKLDDSNLNSIPRYASVFHGNGDGNDVGTGEEDDEV